MTTFRKLVVAANIAVMTSIPAMAQQATPPYGTPISLEQAKKVIAAGEAEAQKNKFFVVITVAVLYRRSSKAFEDAIAGGGIGLRVLGLQGAVPYEGGVPIIVDGKIIGAVGVSGMLPQQDGQVANAAAGAVK